MNYLAENKSSKVPVTEEDCKKLFQNIRKYKPKVVILLHSKVIKWFVEKYLGIKKIKEHGYLGKLIDECNTIFYNVPFPHGSKIPSSKKIELYKEIKEFLLKNSNC